MTIQIAQRIGRALNVRSATRLKELDQALREMIRAVGPAASTPLSGSIDASQVGSGTFADSRIAQSNVTQHEAALSIDWLQLDSVPATFTPAAHVHAAGDVTSGTFADARIAASNVTQHQAALAILESQITDGALLARLGAEIFYSSSAMADDASTTFAVPRYGLVLVVTAAGTTVAYNGLFWVASSGQTTGSVNVGANFSLGTTVNPDVDGNVNAWMSASATLSIRNRFGSTRTITVIGLGLA